MDTGVIVALGALLVSAIGLLLTGRRDTRGSAAETAKLETKLDSISAGVDEIRVEFKSTRKRVDDLTVAVTALEHDRDAMNHRLDRLEQSPRG